MKNYNIVFGLVLSSIFSTGAHAVSVVQNADAHRGRTPVATGGGGFPQLAGNGHLMLAHAGGGAPANLSLRQRSVDSAIIPAFDQYLSFANLPDAFYYSEGGTHAVQSLRAETKMAQQAAALEDVAEPASELLLLAGLSALAIAVRRQSPS